MPTISVDGTNIHFVDAGRGDPPVLLLHAFPFHSGMWEQQVDALADSRRVIVPDLKGFGRSDAPDDITAYSMTSYAHEIVEILDLLEVERVVVAGLSMGGYIAFTLARGHRDRMAGLVLADTKAEADSPEALERRSAQQRKVAEEGTAPVIEALLDTLLSQHTLESRPDVVERARKLMDNPPAGFRGGLEAIKARPDSTQDLYAALSALRQTLR
jgi:3-oxoadipate enol-lactonase